MRDADAMGKDGAATAARGTPFAVDVARDRRSRATIAVFVAGPLIWSVHFMFVYLVVDAGCTGDGPGLRLLHPPVPTVVTLAATVVAALACLATAAWGYRRWRAGRQGPVTGEAGDRSQGVAEHDPGGSMAFGGLLLSLLGFVSVLFVGVPALFLPAC